MSCSVGPQLLCGGGLSLAVAPTSWISTLLALAWLQPPLTQALSRNISAHPSKVSPLLALCLHTWSGAMLEGRQYYWQQSRVRRGGSVQSGYGGSSMGLFHLFSDAVHHRFHL